jgi:hypothetical protein
VVSAGGWEPLDESSSSAALRLLADVFLLPALLDFDALPPLSEMITQ